MHSMLFQIQHRLKACPQFIPIKSFIGILPVQDCERKPLNTFQPLLSGFVIIILAFKSELTMEKQRDNKIEFSHSQNIQKSGHQPTYSVQKLLDSSEILLKQKINSDVFGCLSSFYFKESPIDHQNPPLLLHFQRKPSQQYSYFQDQSHVQVLSFLRGYSEQFNPFEHQSCIQFLKPSQQSKINEISTAKVADRPQTDHAKAFAERGQSGQDLQSDSINSQPNIYASNSQSRQHHSTGLMVKNVTKNIGKLLFKFIWKNRKYLKGVMGTDQEVWERLMCVIRGCKKQNNVTRQFLLSRFHSQGEQFRMFRVLAHHFFRKHCLAAIFNSKIKAKRIHFERIKKFNQALTNVRALDYLA